MKLSCIRFEVFLLLYVTYTPYRLRKGGDRWIKEKSQWSRTNSGNTKRKMEQVRYVTHGNVCFLLLQSHYLVLIRNDFG
jgi:hypothetical protein